MSHVRGRGNAATELAMIALFRKHRLTGWRRHWLIFGNPDFVFRQERLAVFVDGCFWHACPHHGSRPASNKKFWGTKLERNRARDVLVNQTLRARGWCVIRIWQHDLAKTRRTACARRIARALATRRIRLGVHRGALLAASAMRSPRTRDV
jgi:DNA mismatch endonuclease (patch repair protein)